MTDRLMLLDTAGIYFRAFYGVPDTVTAPDGTVVNAVRGTLDIVARLVSQFEPTHLVACWDDDWRPQWRVDLIPTYKTHRVAIEVEVGPDVEVVPDPSRVGYYGRLVVEASLFRQVEKAGAELVHAGAARRDTVDELFATVHQACTPVIATRRRYDQATADVCRSTGEGPVPLGRAIAADQVVARIEQARALSR